MSRNPRPILCALIVLCAAAVADAQNDNGPFRVFTERVPPDIQKGRDELDARLRGNLGKIEGVIESGRQWNPGATVTVAFRDAPDAVCEKIAAVADEWTAHGNLKFCFRTADGKIRRWTTADKEYAADIRVGFDDPIGGYFSVIGTESRDPELVRPGRGSMNFQGFDKRLPEHEWKRVVRHEFGHAIGFHHEHQHPRVPCDFRMEDDPGYAPKKNEYGEFIPDDMKRRPGIYTVLGGPPNCWSKKDVDDNFKPLPKDSRRFEAGEFDKHSIMKYYQESWMYKGGKDSHCFNGGWNDDFSKGDKETMKKVYPSDEAGIKQRLAAIEAFNKARAKKP